MRGCLVNILWLAAGGILGVSARYALSTLVSHRTGSGFPWGTLTVNLVGMFLAGIVAALAERWQISPELRLFVFVGLLGGFTTFSAFGLETLALLRNGQYLYACINLAASTIIGLGLVVVGYLLGRGMASLLH